ncbi:LysR family transcriptional regulator [Humidisolicoccus flavus]|uniref:LysR family transcriptional regulator n=1 Tax=Humidisolicoccus flavus TaxID=3111414 RepID=UPI003251F3A2
MDLYQLRVLRELADHGSITATAEALGVTPSAVSQVIQSLQQGFRAPLTMKDGRTTRVSDAGLALVDASARVAIAVAEAEASVDSYLQDETTSVSVAAFHSAALTFFPELARAAASGDSPPVACSDEDVAQDAFPALTARYDIVIAHRMAHAAPWPHERLVVVPLLREPMDVAMRADHPLASKPRLRAQDVADESWIEAHDGFSPADLLDSVAAAAGRPMRVAHRINDYSTATAIVAQSSSVTLLPRFTATPSAESGVVLRELTGIRSVRHIDLLMRPEQRARQSVAKVEALLQSIARTRQDTVQSGEHGEHRARQSRPALK